MISCTKLGLCLVFVLATVQTVSSISCYYCKSHIDKGCDAEVVNKSYIKDCREFREGAKYTLCRKIEQWVDVSDPKLSNPHRVIRTCGWNQTNERSCYYVSGFGGRREVCSCYTDNCNGASQFSLTTFTLIMSFVLFIVNFVI